MPEFRKCPFCKHKRDLDEEWTEGKKLCNICCEMIKQRAQNKRDIFKTKYEIEKEVNQDIKPPETKKEESKAKTEIKVELKEPVRKYEDPLKDIKMDIKEDHFTSETKEKPQPKPEPQKAQTAKIIGHANNTKGSFMKYALPAAGLAIFSLLNKRAPIQNPYLINDYYN